MSSVKLVRNNIQQPWGFRIHGGKDFNQPLVVMKVTSPSIASQHLSPGDVILKINQHDAANLTHSNAENLIRNSGNAVEFLVARGMNTTWKPMETETGFSLKKPYNSPIGLYSEQSIAETLSAQSEVLKGGAIGVNFKKNEKKYDYENSEVYKMLQKAESDPEDLMKKIETIETKNVGKSPESSTTTTTAATAGDVNVCAECERLIVGVFVRIREKNLHVDCFKCATCGSSLKNVGYFNVNNKLYCDVHAKLVAKQLNPEKAADFSPVTTMCPTSPLTHLNINTDWVGKVTPIPFHHSPTQITHVTAPTKEKFKQQHIPYVPVSNLEKFSKFPRNISPKFFVPQQKFGNQPNSPDQKFGSFEQSSTPQSKEPRQQTTILGNRIFRGILNQPSQRMAICGVCQMSIRGPFISTAKKFYCPGHFTCLSCSRSLMEIGFVDLNPNLHCEFCWESSIAPNCAKCNKRIKYECLKALNMNFHPECFRCKKCNMEFGNKPFFVEDNQPYCQGDWNELFTTKCSGCGFPIEAGDRWVEALGANYHSQCFNCTACKKNLEGQSFFAKKGHPFCKAHAR